MRVAVQNRRREATKVAIDQAALEWRAPVTTTSVVHQLSASDAVLTAGAFDRILKRLRAASDDGHDGDHAAKVLATSANDPPVDILAEARRILKRARDTDECQRHDATKWRALYAAPESGRDNTTDD